MQATATQSASQSASGAERRGEESRGEKRREDKRRREKSPIIKPIVKRTYEAHLLSLIIKLMIRKHSS